MIKIVTATYINKTAAADIPRTRIRLLSCTSEAKQRAESTTPNEPINELGIGEVRMRKGEINDGRYRVNSSG